MLEDAISTLKDIITINRNSSEFDMMRLQAMSERRNEVFEVMAEFLRKMAQSRSSIIDNMR